MRPPRPPRPAPEVAEQRYTIMLFPEGGGQVRQWTWTLRELRRLLIGAVLLLGLLLVLGARGSLSIGPGALSGQRLVDENLALKARLREIEGKLQGVDRELERLRLYDAQLRDLPADQLPGSGPISEEDWAAWQELHPEASGAPPPELVGTLGDPLDELPEQAVPFGSSAWLSALDRRAEDTLAALRATERNMGHLAETAEGWRAHNAAVPTAWPIEAVLTSGFGWRRSPFTRRWKFHSGLDLAAPRGTPIYAAADGEVIWANWDSGYGRLVEIDHGNNIITRYGHNSRLYVQEGDHVRQGQLISTVGMTGQTTGPHLHYEIHVDGVAVDPLDYLR